MKTARRSFYAILASKFFGDGNQKLPIALGKDIGGEPVVSNLAKMPLLFDQGQQDLVNLLQSTHDLVTALQLTPDECRLIMIDPRCGAECL